MRSSPGASSAPLAFVVPRFGADIAGGAESLCRLVARDLAGAGVAVEVFTTCARDHFTWRNELPAGTTVEDGVLVHRFPVDEDRDPRLFAEVHHRIARAEAIDYADQVLWLANSVTSSAVERAVAERRDVALFLALPYLFGTTFWAVANDPDRTALIPCLHDEPYARLPAVRRMLALARGCLANSPAERELILRMAPGARTAVGGVGFHPPGRPANPGGFCAARGIEPGYLLYAGRREEAKGLPMLFDHYARFAERHPAAPPLALMGSGDLPPPRAIADRTIDLGFVPEEEMRHAFAAAAVLVHPSRLESFGMVLMEAWLESTPALVNGRSPVLVAHCRESGGGLWFTTYPEFAEALELLLDEDGTAEALGRAGRDYVGRAYSWERVRERYLEAVGAWAV